MQNNLDVTCGSVGSMDSWIALRAEGITILNLNDCVMSPAHLAYVSKLVGKVTGLFTQFSFADWIGNHADEKGAAQRKLQDLQFRVQLLGPEFTVPFASFIYFCNQENSWMNAYAVTPQRVADLGLPGINFMYPGDEWDSITRVFRSPQAIARYTMDVASPKTIDSTPEAVDLNKLQHTVDRMLRVLRSRFSSYLMARIPPFRIYLHDQDSVLEVNPAGSCEVFRADAASGEEARFVMSSQVAWFAFAYAWGWGAMEISGMYLDRR
jgi:UDP-MurNAc hydroxylase